MLFQELASPWDSTAQTNLMHERLNRLLANQSEARRSEFPPINIWANEEKAFVVAEVPGINSDDLDLQVVNQVLTLKTKREPDQLKDAQSWHRRERGYGQFTRSLELPFAVDPEKVTASYSQGVLRIELPRARADMPKKISIQAS